jgi:PAS domain-containing protein
VQELSESLRQMTVAIEDRERRLRESEEKYRLLIENAGDAIFVAQDGRLPFANRRTEELTGADAAALRSVPWVDLVHPADRAARSTTAASTGAGAVDHDLQDRARGQRGALSPADRSRCSGKDARGP